MKTLEISPEIIGKLSSEDSKLWLAAHEDGSDNRINGDAILNTSSKYGEEFGVISAIFQGIRKLFRNRNKTWQDLEAEKEAYRINKTCGALEEMLLEYLQAAREGTEADQESLDELIDTLEEIHGYYRSGKLVVPGEKELSEIRKSIEEYTAAITGDHPDRAAQGRQKANADEFVLIRDLLLKQKNNDKEIPFFIYEFIRSPGISGAFLFSAFFLRFDLFSAQALLMMASIQNAQ